METSGEGCCSDEADFLKLQRAIPSPHVAHAEALKLSIYTEFTVYVG